MVQVVENRADIEGRLVAVRDDGTRPGHQIVTVDVTQAHPVESYPNLFADAAGSCLELVVRAGNVRASAGETVRCRVRRAGPTTIFADSCEIVR